MLARREDDLDRTLRQLELRVGDLTERQTATREDLAAFAARMRQLDVSAAAPAASPPEPAPAVEHSEGH